ncbi:hypothetical protein FACS1894160_3750 [Bacteroidia bacterium]|nr:hypothetical protein FACS1894123_08660 [Bacteroidia bacterium]GHV08819.1 hypothetical protein FACS1894160_3750 [Bacteroidia bacterium]
MNKTYFITLTPYDLYFFGGEQEQIADYYLKGNSIPQQTALLGMLRYQILLQNGLLENNRIKDDVDAAKWIGKESFQYSNATQTFGKVDSISSCYLVEKTDTDTKKYLPTHPVYMEGWEVIDGNYFLPSYDPKKYYRLRWKNIENPNDVVDDFFDEVERVGVDKNYTGQTDNDSFYKQVWLKLSICRENVNHDFSFGFYVTIADDVKLENANVNLGKENSVFRMSVIEETASDEVHEPNANAIVLVCDAYVDPEILQQCDFAVCDTLPFRNLVNQTAKTHNHYDLHKSTTLLQLLKRGTILIANDSKQIEAIGNSLNKYANFVKIGYNKFQTIKI